MAVISFWSQGKEQTGKSSSIVAISTLLGINYDYKTLVLDTNYNNDFYIDCYWQQNKNKKTIESDIMGTDIENGINGLARLILSNKALPELITNYTKVIYVNHRLELLTDTEVKQEEYKVHKKIFKDIVKLANMYYDLVFVDINPELDNNIKESLLEMSDLIIVNLQQKLRNINEYLEFKKQNLIFMEKPILPILGRYDKYSKYNIKNVARYMKEKRRICAIPYNTLFFEACSEGKVVEFFIKFRNINPQDRNAIFINEVNLTIERIIEKLKEIRMGR